MQRRRLLLTLILVAVNLSPCHAQETYQTESERLAKLMHWQAGSVVAEIGAGEGEMTLAAARRVGPTGHVYSTELDDKKLEDLKSKAAADPLHNITVLKAAIAETHLPPACCNAIFMRHVYHHFAQPATMDSSLFASLKPGGMVAIIDFPPKSGLPPVEGVPANRGGRGVPARIVVEELTAAGFQVTSAPLDFPDGDFCVLARKPPQ